MLKIGFFPVNEFKALRLSVSAIGTRQQRGLEALMSTLGAGQIILYQSSKFVKFPAISSHLGLVTLTPFRERHLYLVDIYSELNFIGRKSKMAHILHYL